MSDRITKREIPIHQRCDFLKYLTEYVCHGVLLILTHDS